MLPVATVGDLVTLGAQRSPGRVAVREREGRARTYAALEDRTTRLANGLLGAGLQPGDRVAAWMEDGLEYVELYVAAAKAGLVVVPVNARYRAGEARHLLEDSAARMLVWTPGLEEAVGELDTDLPEVHTGEGRGTSWEALAQAGAPAPPPRPEPGDLYVLGYTSGTTGAPKGAMLTHRSVLAIARLNTISYGLPIGSVAALTGSMSFVATVPAHVLTHFYVGGTNVIMGRWDAESLLRTIAAERATFTYLPGPTMPEFCALARERTQDWSSLQSVLHSASRAEPDKLRELCAVIGDRFVEGWGMTENSGGLMTATTRADVLAADPRTYESVGRAVTEVLVGVRGPDGELLPRDGESIGELVFRSPALMDGYLGRPEETAEALRDGWFHSGDLGVMDRDGYVTIADRRTDLIVTGGMNVYPTEVEDCITALADVAECAVVGVPHERWGQTVVAVVVPASGAGVDADDVVAHCRRQLASYKKPTAVLRRDDLPRTTSMKVRRGEIRAWAIDHLSTNRS